MEHLPTFTRLANRKPADPRERFPNASSAHVPAYRYRYARRISAHKCANKLQNRFALGAEKPIGRSAEGEEERERERTVSNRAFERSMRYISDRDGLATNSRFNVSHSTLAGTSAR